MSRTRPRLLILNQMAGPLGWEHAEDSARRWGGVFLHTGHPDILAKGDTDRLRICPAPPYHRGTLRQRAVSWLRYLVAASFWLRKYPVGSPLLLYSNPPMLPWLGYLRRRLFGQPYAVMI